MDLDVPFVDLPFVVETAYFRRPDKKFTVILAAKIPGSQVAFMKKSGKHETEFDFAWKITDAKNHVAGGLRDTLPVRMTNDTYEEVIGSNLFLRGRSHPAPGKIQFEGGGARERKRQNRNLRGAAGDSGCSRYGPGPELRHRAVQRSEVLR